MCGLVIKTEGDKVVDVRGDKADPLSRGMSAQGGGIAGYPRRSDRLRKP